MMSVFDLFDGCMELATQSLCQPNPKNLRNLVDGKFPQSQLARALEYFVDGKVFSKDEVPTKLDLSDRIEACQIDCLAFTFREFLD